MKQPWLIGPHGVLIKPKLRQPMRHEIFQNPQRLFPCHRPAKTFGARINRAGVIGQLGIDPVNHLSSHIVWGQAKRLSKAWWARLGKGCPILMVEVPLPAHGPAVLHQHIMALAKFPIPILQPKLLAPLRMLAEIGHRGEEVGVFKNLKWNAAGAADRTNRVEHPPIARGSHSNASGPVQTNGRLKLSGQ